MKKIALNILAFVVMISAIATSSATEVEATNIVSAGQDTIVRFFAVFDEYGIQEAIENINDTLLPGQVSMIMIWGDIALPQTETIYNRSVIIASVPGSNASLSAASGFSLSAPLISVAGGGILTLEDITIGQRSVADISSPAVEVHDGILNITSGTQIAGSGQGVRVNANGIVNISGGLISNNSNAVVVTSNGMLNMTGGTISDNTSHGVVLSANGANFTMTGGTIENNGYNGVHAQNDTTFDMSGGVIRNHNNHPNTSDNASAIRAFDRVTIDLHGSAVIDEHDTSINVSGNGGQVNVRGARIINN